MHCAECQSFLSDYIDGDLSGRERRYVDEHLGACDICETLREDLARIVEASAQLPLHTPSPRVWERIEREIAASRVAPGPRAWWDRLEARRFDFSVSGRQLTAAAAALLVAVGSIWAISVTSPNTLPTVNVNWGEFETGDRPVTAAQLASATTEVDRFRASVGEMEKTVSAKQANWSPELRAAFAKGVGEIDARIADAERGYASRPDRASRDALMAALGEKLEMLEKFAKI